MFSTYLMSNKYQILNVHVSNAQISQKCKITSLKFGVNAMENIELAKTTPIFVIIMRNNASYQKFEME